MPVVRDAAGAEYDVSEARAAVLVARGYTMVGGEAEPEPAAEAEEEAEPKRARKAKA